tara:strand:- start:317 stop:658 length:342 start_codon:yes stop_codon:yes gene_type:complete
MKHYEITSILKPDLTENAIKELINNIEKNIKDIGGNIVDKENWGHRDLAYPIKNNKKGYYLFLQVDVNGDNLDTFRNFSNLNENIIRYLIINVEEHEKLPTAMAKIDKENEEK